MANTVLGFTIELKGTSTAIGTAEELRRAIAEIQKELKNASDTESIKKLESKLIDLKARQNEVNKEIRESVKERQRELTAIDQSSGAYNKLSNQLNESRKRLKDLEAAEKGSTDEAKALRIEVEKLDTKLKGIDASVGQFQRNVGNYSGALNEFFPKISGLVDTTSKTFGNISKSFNSTESGLSRLGSIAEITAGAFAIFSAVSDIIGDLNQNLEETRAISAQIQNFTGATGDVLNKSVAQAKAVSETYKAEVNDVLVAANSLSKNLGVDFTKALDLIEVGFRKGANAQGEFLDGLREYPVQFRDAGASAEQFIKISIAAAKEGIYSDKGLDAVKEFSLRIREQTKATGDALKSALGSEFTNKLFSDLNKGAITSVDALGKVTTALKENGVQGAKLQTVIADVFGGPGEDVGQRFLFVLGDILSTTEDVTQSSNAYQKQLNELYQANLELNEAQSGYNEALANVSFEFEVAKTKAKAFFASILAGAFEFANQLPATFKAVGNAVKAFFSTGAITEAADAYNKTFKQEIRKIKDDDTVQKTLLEQVNKADQPVQKKFKSIGKSSGESFVAGSVAAIQQEKSKLDKAFEQAVAGSDAQAAIAVNLKKVEKQLEDAITAQNKILEQGNREALKKQLGTFEEIATKGIPQSIQSINQATKGVEKITGAVNKSVIETKDTVKLSFQEIADSSAQIFQQALNIIGSFQRQKAEQEKAVFDEQIQKINDNITKLEEKQKTVGRIRAKQIQLEIEDEKKKRDIAQRESDKVQKEAAKKEQNLARIQAIIQIALGISRAIALPFPLNIVQAAVVAATGAAQIATINAQKFATGGLITGRRVTDRQNINTLSNGDNVLATVRRGEVVLNEQQQAALGGARTFKRIGVPGFADGGVIGAPIASPALTTENSTFEAFIQIIDKKTDAINARIDRLQAYVVTDEIARDLEEGNRLKIQATL